MLAGLSSQSYDARKPSVFVYFPVMDFASFNDNPQALHRNCAYACGSPLNENDQDTIKSTSCWMCLERGCGIGRTTISLCNATNRITCTQ